MEKKPTAGENHTEKKPTVGENRIFTHIVGESSEGTRLGENDNFTRDAERDRDRERKRTRERKRKK